MAFGDILARSVGALFGTPESMAFGGFVGNLMRAQDEDENREEASRRANADANFARELGFAGFNLSLRNEAEQKAIRDRILTQTGSLRDDLRQTLANLGQRPTINQDTVNRDFATIRDRNRESIFALFDRAASTDRATMIRRGVGESTPADDARNTIMRTFARTLREGDTAAYDAALQRNTGLSNLITGDRSAAFNELRGIYNAPLEHELTVLQAAPGASTPLGAAALGYSNITDLSNKAAISANTAAGNVFASLRGDLPGQIATFFNLNSMEEDQTQPVPPPPPPPPPPNPVYGTDF